MLRRNMQRGEALRIGLVDIGPGLEQHRGYFALAKHDSEHQSRESACGDLVDSCARSSARSGEHRRHMLRRNMQRGEALRIGLVDIGPGLEQHRGYFALVIVSSEHQSRTSAFGELVDACPHPKECRCHRRMAKLRRTMKRGVHGPSH